MTISQHSAELAAWISSENCGAANDGLHLGPTDLALAMVALRILAALAAAVSPPEAPEIA